MKELIDRNDTIKNYVPIGSLELKLAVAVARAEGYAWFDILVETIKERT